MISYYVHRYSLILGAVVVLFISSCTSKQTKTDKSNEVDSMIDTISVSEATEEVKEEMADDDARGEVDIFRAYVKNHAILESDTAACNRGREPFKQFVTRFSDERPFRESRICLSDGFESASVDTDENDLIQRMPDEEGFFSAWRVVQADSVVFTSGWINSEVAEEYTFTRNNDGLWFLVEYFNINDSQA